MRIIIVNGAVSADGVYLNARFHFSSPEGLTRIAEALGEEWLRRVPEYIVREKMPLPLPCGLEPHLGMGILVRMDGIMRLLDDVAAKCGYVKLTEGIYAETEHANGRLVDCIIELFGSEGIAAVITLEEPRFRTPGEVRALLDSARRRLEAAVQRLLGITR